MKYKSEDQWPRIIECGPGTSLISMLRIMNGKMAKGAMVMSAWKIEINDAITKWNWIFFQGGHLKWKMQL